MIERRAFFVQDRTGQLTYRCASALELFDRCMHCRTRQSIYAIHQVVKGDRCVSGRQLYARRLLSPVSNPMDPEALEEACAVAWERWEG